MNNKSFKASVSGLAAGLLVAGLAVFGTNAAVAAYDNNGSSSASQVAPGGSFTLRVFGVAPNSAVTFQVTTQSGGAPTLAVAGTSSITVNADGGGNAAVTVTIPANAGGDVGWMATTADGTVIARGALSTTSAGGSNNDGPQHPAAG